MLNQLFRLTITKRFTTGFFISLAIFSISSNVSSQESSRTYPAKPIHLVVPFPAGGSADLVARIIAKPLSEKLGQPVLIDNKPGADGALAAQIVATSPADGYTLFMATYGAMSAVPYLHKGITYDPVKDFTPITSTGIFSMFLFVHPSLGVKSVRELISYERAHSGQLNYGTGNTASIVFSAQLNRTSDLHMTQVPYKGEVPAMNDFITNRIQLMFATPANALQFVKEGKLGVLATLSEKRSPLLPETPTWLESGMSEFDVVPWSGIFGPTKLPEEITNKLSIAINEVLKHQEIIDDFAALGFEPHGSTPNQLAQYTSSQLKKWHIAIENAGIKPE